MMMMVLLIMLLMMMVMIRSMMKMFLLQNFIVDLQKRPDDLSDDDVDDQYDADTRKMLI